MESAVLSTVLSPIRPLLKALRRKGAGIPIDIDPRQFQPSLQVPAGLTRADVLRMLASITIDGSSSDEIRNYAKRECDRFLHTLELVPQLPLSLLEIGSNPYFMTVLIKLFRPSFRIELVNYFGGDASTLKQQVSVTTPNGRQASFQFHYVNVNLEGHSLPFENDRFDLVLFCEVLEHLTADPLRALLELKRVLKRDGILIVTTPNVARIENIARLLKGENLYDPFSGYGPYGRHNREYTRHELCKLLEHCGFAEEVTFTADVHDNIAGRLIDLRELSPLLHCRKHDLGQYIFSRWRNRTSGNSKKPSWLYRSYRASEIEELSLY